MWTSKTASVRCWGNEVSKTLIRMCPTTKHFSLLISSREMQLGFLQHLITMAEGDNLSKKMLREMAWKLLSVLDTQIDPEPVFSPISSFSMNILLWNCRGALNPRFHLALTSLINTHSPFRCGGDYPTS